MATDILILGGFVFEDFSVPAEMPAGGDQAMVVHKLPGGSRVIDTLGPDEAPIIWRGQMFGDDAYFEALTLDGMRAAGQKIPLIYGGRTRQVVINSFTYKIHRYPNWVSYDISCTVASNPAQGGLAIAIPSIESIVMSDLGAALSAVSDIGTTIGVIAGIDVTFEVGL